MITLQKGDKAPDFTLFSTERTEVSLSDFEGRKVLLLYFPLAFTSTCTEELCSVRDEFGFYQDLDVEVFGISIDAVPSLIRYKDDQRLGFSLLSDCNREAIRAYGTVYEQFGHGLRGVAKRSAFVIDRSGHIQYAEVLDNAGELPNFDAIRATLRALD